MRRKKHLEVVRERHSYVMSPWDGRTLDADDRAEWWHGWRLALVILLMAGLVKALDWLFEGP